MVIEKSSVDEIDALDVWACLKAVPGAQLIDVRTTVEWTQIGVPDLTDLGIQPILLEWRAGADGRGGQTFRTALEAELAARGAVLTTDLFFICRSGVRSFAAAQEMAAAGFSRCHNVADGFEGPPDHSGQRGTVAGWQAAGLSWSRNHNAARTA